MVIKRWPISQRRRTKVYGAIAETTMNLRIEVKKDGETFTPAHVDELLYRLHKQIWREVAKVLGVPS